MIYTFTINIKFCNVKCSLHSLLIFCVHGIIIIIVDPCGIRDKVSITADLTIARRNQGGKEGRFS